MGIRERVSVDPVFVAGSGRSGTTILGRTLALHPKILGFLDETRFLVAKRGALLDWVFQPEDETLRREFLQGIRGGFWGRPAVRELLECPVQSRPQQVLRRLYRGGFYTRPVSRTRVDVGLCRAVEHRQYRQAVRELLQEMPGSSLEDRLRSVDHFCSCLFGEAMTQQGAHRWLDDTPRNSVYLYELSRVFPDLRVVHIIRDGRDVAGSYSRLRWIPSTRQALHMWFERVTIARSVGKMLGPERYLEVVFERLMRHPERELRRILQFLGEEWVPEMSGHGLDSERASAQRQTDAELDNLFWGLAAELAEEYGWPR